MGFVIAIDGPAGAGKSTVARRLARLLGWRFLDSGALYRAVTLAALEQSIDPADGIRLAAVVPELELTQTRDGRTLMGRRDVSRDIRDEKVTQNVSAVSAHPEVRRALIELQRDAARLEHLVCEGRDMGSVVFPDAKVKVFLDADIPTRALRRRRELGDSAEEVGQEEMERRLIERDRKDASRTYAPLARIPDQIYVDTSSMPLEAVIESVRTLVVRVLHLEESPQERG